MHVSISEAHKMTGVARSTIYKDIDDGKLSCTTSSRGKKTIMVSELQRVYGNIKLLETDEVDIEQKLSSNVVEDKKRSNNTNSSTTDQIAVLQERIESLTLRMQNKEEFIDDLKEERKKNRAMFEEQIESLKEALNKSQENQNKTTLLLEHYTKGEGAVSDNSWQKSLKALEDRIANQEAAVQEKIALEAAKTAKEAKEKEELKAQLEEKERILAEKEEALALEKKKSFVHKLLGR